MSRPTPETKWYVTEYPIECSFAVTDGNEIIATIIGGDTIGNQCDLASRIAKLPDLERERDEARAIARDLAVIASHCLGWHDHESTDAAIRITAALKRWKKSK